MGVPQSERLVQSPCNGQLIKKETMIIKMTKIQVWTKKKIIMKRRKKMIKKKKKK